MKRLRWVVVGLLLAMMSVSFLQAQDANQDASKNTNNERSLNEETQERFFLPRDTFWGFVQFDIAPPHNEIDPNLCNATAGITGGINDPCNAFARYSIWGQVEFRPFGRGKLRNFMIFGEPRLLLGKNLPQTLYTWSMDPIGIERSWGAAVYFGHGLEFRFTQHFLFQRLGSRDQQLGQFDLGPNGPWGRYNTFGVRKTFGTKRWE